MGAGRSLRRVARRLVASVGAVAPDDHVGGGRRERVTVHERRRTAVGEKDIPGDRAVVEVSSDCSPLAADVLADQNVFPIPGDLNAGLRCARVDEERRHEQGDRTHLVAHRKRDAPSLAASQRRSSRRGPGGRPASSRPRRPSSPWAIAQRSSPTSFPLGTWAPSRRSLSSQRPRRFTRSRRNPGAAEAIGLTETFGSESGPFISKPIVRIASSWPPRMRPRTGMLLAASFRP